MSAEGNNDQQNGDVKKDDDLHEDGTETSEKKKETKPEQDEKHQNGDVRNRKTAKVQYRTKADLKRAVLKTKPPSRKEQHKSLVSKWLSVVNNGVANAMNKTPWVVKLMWFLCAMGLAFATRFVNVSFPTHIW